MFSSRVGTPSDVAESPAPHFTLGPQSKSVPGADVRLADPVIPIAQQRFVDAHSAVGGVASVPVQRVMQCNLCRTGGQACTAGQPWFAVRDTVNSPAPADFETNMVGFVEEFVGKDYPFGRLRAWIRDKFGEVMRSLIKTAGIPYGPRPTRETWEGMTKKEQLAWSKARVLNMRVTSNHELMRNLRLTLDKAHKRGASESVAADLLWALSEYQECRIGGSALIQYIENLG